MSTLPYRIKSKIEIVEKKQMSKDVIVLDEDDDCPILTEDDVWPFKQQQQALKQSMVLHATAPITTKKAKKRDEKSKAKELEERKEFDNYMWHWNYQFREWDGSEWNQCFATPTFEEWKENKGVLCLWSFFAHRISRCAVFEMVPICTRNGRTIRS